MLAIFILQSTIRLFMKCLDILETSNIAKWWRTFIPKNQEVLLSLHMQIKPKLRRPRTKWIIKISMDGKWKSTSKKPIQISILKPIFFLRICQLMSQLNSYTNYVLTMGTFSVAKSRRTIKAKIWVTLMFNLKNKKKLRKLLMIWMGLKNGDLN